MSTRALFEDLDRKSLKGILDMKQQVKYTEARQIYSETETEYSKGNVSKDDYVY